MNHNTCAVNFFHILENSIVAKLRRTVDAVAVDVIVAVVASKVVVADVVVVDSNFLFMIVSFPANLRQHS